MNENQAKVTFENHEGKKIEVLMTDEGSNLDMKSSFNPPLDEDEKGIHAHIYVHFMESFNAK